MSPWVAKDWGTGGGSRIGTASLIEDNTRGVLFFPLGVWEDWDERRKNHVGSLKMEHHQEK